MTDADMIKHLWTHKTQDHPILSDEELLIEHADLLQKSPAEHETSTQKVADRPLVVQFRLRQQEFAGVPLVR